MVEREVRKERSNWRDPDLGPWHRKHGFDYSVADPNDTDFNNRHRQWGYDCPAVDIDQLFIEYNRCFPIALVDYKLRDSLKVPEPNRNAANLRTFCELRTTKGPLPIYVTYYTKDPWTFRPIWINTQAKQLMPRKQLLTESGYVEWLYWLRDRTADSAVISRLDNLASWDFPPPIDTHHKPQKKRKVQSPVPTLFDQTPPLQNALWEVPV